MVIRNLTGSKFEIYRQFRDNIDFKFDLEVRRTVY